MGPHGNRIETLLSKAHMVTSFLLARDGLEMGIWKGSLMGYEEKSIHVRIQFWESVPPFKILVMEDMTLFSRRML